MNERMLAILSNPETELVSEEEHKWTFYHPHVGYWSVYLGEEEEPHEE